MREAKSRANAKQLRRAKPARVAEVRIQGGWSDASTSSNGTQHQYPRVSNPDVAGERERMLEKRQKLTLKAFQIAYENQHRRKSS